MVAQTAPRALVSSPLMPEFDRESGSRRLFHLIEFLSEAGYAVSFTTQDSDGDSRYVKMLQQKGVATYRGFGQYTRNLFQFGRLDVAIFAFWHHAEAHIEELRSASPETRIIVDAIDLHWLRQARRSFLYDSDDYSVEGLDSAFAAEMVRELNTYAAADAVLTVSDKEAHTLNDMLSDRSFAYPVPDCEDITPSDIPFEERRGILFVGNFNHPPNAAAATFLCENILPELDAEVLEKHPVYIVGNGTTGPVLQYGSESPYVRVVGWVPSLTPYLERAAISVVPLRYGAGTKRKLVHSMMAGTPAVSTTIGIEGLDAEHERDVLVADDPVDFARSIERLLSDKELWTRLAQESSARIAEVHGREVVRARFLDALEETANRPPIDLRTVRVLRPEGSDGKVDHVDRIRQTVRDVVPSRSCVMVVSRGDPELVKMPGRKAWHFPRTKDGRYAGFYPADSAEAIKWLEELRMKGGSYLLFPRTGFWWLDHYKDLKTYLSKHYERVWSDDTCVIFHLSAQGNGQVAQGQESQSPAPSQSATSSKSPSSSVAAESK
jgi:glycosyltransferase involved in cell wall biosynthesis